MNDKILPQWPFTLFLLLAILVIFVFTALTHSYGGGPQPARGTEPASALRRVPRHVWSPVLNVVMPSSLREGINPYGPGMELDLLDIFLERRDYGVRHVYADSYDAAMSMLEKKEADLMIGFGSDVSFQPEHMGRSPALSEFYMVLVVLPDGEPGGFDLGNAHFNKVAYSAAQLEVLKSHAGRGILLDPATYALLLPMYPQLQTAGQLAEKTGYYWFWNKRNIMLDAELAEFWADPAVGGSIAEMRERYYGFMPEKPMQDQLLEMNLAISKRIDAYSEYISRAAAENDLDPLLLLAVIFQESRFNPAARSHTGVRGIMQLTLPTADMLGVDRMVPEESIMGGARYLRQIYDSLGFVEKLDEIDRWCLTLAGFNQGPTVMRRAVKAAQDSGLNPDWAGMRGFYYKLQSKGLAGAAFRPKEAVRYVENVRYYYYVLSGLARQGWPEYENLAAFLASR